jgi:hypothetical protein
MKRSRPKEASKMKCWTEGFPTEPSVLLSTKAFDFSL